MSSHVRVKRAQTRKYRYFYTKGGGGCLFEKYSNYPHFSSHSSQSDKRIPLNEVARRRLGRESARRDEGRVFPFLYAALVAFIVVVAALCECSGNAFFSSFFFPRDARRFGDTTDISFKPVERFLQSGSVAISQTLWRGLLRTRVAELDVRVLRSANAGGCDRV